MFLAYACKGGGGEWAQIIKKKKKKKKQWHIFLGKLCHHSPILGIRSSNKDLNDLWKLVFWDYTCGGGMSVQIILKSNKNSSHIFFVENCGITAQY